MKSIRTRTELRKHLYCFPNKLARLSFFNNSWRNSWKVETGGPVVAYATVAATMCMKVPDYLKDMLVRAKLQFEGFDNATQPQKPHTESVRPVFALCHTNQWTLFYTIFQPPSYLSHTQNPRKNSPLFLVLVLSYFGL